MVRLSNLAACALDDRPKTADGALDLLLVELGNDYEHGFVSVDLCLLRSRIGSSTPEEQGLIELPG